MWKVSFGSPGLRSLQNFLLVTITVSYCINGATGTAEEESSSRHKRALDRIGSGFIKRDSDVKIDELVPKLRYYLAQAIAERNGEPEVGDKRSFDRLGMGFIKKRRLDRLSQGFIKRADDDDVTKVYGDETFTDEDDDDTELNKRYFDRLNSGFIRREVPDMGYLGSGYDSRGTFDRVGSRIFKKSFDRLGSGFIKRRFDRLNSGLIKRNLDRLNSGFIKRQRLDRLSSGFIKRGEMDKRRLDRLGSGFL
uniref:Uncharacterized protein LOC111133193 n=1 Tax=Crassostrea virginica TaxID=6565 RepID=A0A8B8EA71_CRAVI|nr:uncharacterized protein LOC111133193 [Crassostrea virginica]XP_022337651.1 uncharacterized protein LOC111133493 [Crassostrea virginica]